MDTTEILQKMNAAIDEADRTASAANKAAVSGLATKTCSRCGGKGYDFFMGGSRAPGQCFKCGGEGVVFVAGKAKNNAVTSQAKVELDRLRACWKAVHEAVVAAKATPTSGWAGRHTVVDLERRLAGYEKAGKEQAQIVERNGK